MNSQVAFYGKRPEFEDYIRSDSFAGASKTYQDWLDFSFDRLQAALGTAFKEQFPSLSPTVALIRFSTAADAILGLVRPSHDKSGRPAWFSIFVEVPAEISRQHFSLMAEAFGAFVRTGLQLLALDSGGLAPNRQQESMARLKASLPSDADGAAERFDDFCRQTTLNAFSVSLSSEAGGAVKIIRNLAFAALPLPRNLTDPFRATFRFPLSSKPETRPLEIAFWIALVDAIMDVSRQKRSLFYTDDHLDIAFVAPEEHTLATAVMIDRRNEHLWDFMAMNLQGQSLESHVRETVQSILADGDRTLDKVAEQMAGLAGRKERG